MIKVLIALLFLIGFNAVFFLGLEQTEANWCSYGFVTAAFLMLVATPVLYGKAKMGVLIGSLWLRATMYFITVLVVAVITAIVNPDSMRWPLIIQIVLMVGFMALQLMSVLANDATTASLNQQRAASYAKMMLVEQVQTSWRSTNDPNIRKELGRCVDALTNTPLQTYPEASEADQAVEAAVGTLCAIVSDGDAEKVKSYAGKLLSAIQQRNLVVKRCRML